MCCASKEEGGVKSVERGEVWGGGWGGGGTRELSGKKVVKVQRSGVENWLKQVRNDTVYFG